jgi:hypothetical protein
MLPFVETQEEVMRVAGLAAVIVLSGCMAALTAEPSETIATPGGVELSVWCARFPDPVCRREAAEAARAHCGAAGTTARFVRSALLQRTVTHGQLGWFLYDCVR